MLYNGTNLSVQLHADGIAELCLDAGEGSVNKFDRLTISEFQQALAALEGNAEVKGLLITSTKDAFVVGADIGEFTPMFTEGAEVIREYLGQCNTNFNQLEDMPFPVVVAINGYALGGGCEVCLACDYRIASEDVRIGLPETRLGIIPGWGGTVRLPRIAGIETAVEWIAAAKDQRADAAFKAGVIDGVVAKENLRSAALQTLQYCMDGTFDYEQRREQKTSALTHNMTELTMAFTTSKGFVAAQAGKNYPAPIAAVSAMEEAADQDRDEALAIETDAFVAMSQTTAARSLVGLFLNDQLVGKKAKQLAKAADKKVERAAVLGAGIMGGGISYQSALKGVPVKMKDIAQEGIDLGLNEAAKLLNKRVDRGRMTTAAMSEVLNRIEPLLSYDGFENVDLIVEAVVENPKVKHAVLAEAETKVSEDTVITSNTSTISIDHLAGALKRPENFCGMHFFNPVHAMPLVEVIRGAKTSDNTIARTVAYANKMGKKAIVVNDCPGFLVNRVLFPYFAGFSMLLRDGADFQQIDKVMERWGWPMGPAYLLDVVGIDTGVHAEAVMAEGFPSRMGKNFKAATDILFEAERYGQKNNQGFYNYEKDKKGKPKKVVTDESYALLKPHVADSREFSDDEIIARMIVPMATELARCVEEGIVASVAEADMALIYGLGFPPFRGGVFRWIDTIGINAFCEMANAHSDLGELYQLTPGLQALAADNGSYYS